MNNVTASICAFLDGDEGAVDILNDALELIGAKRVAKAGTTAERLELVLVNLIPRKQAELLACDFAEHVMPIAGLNKRRQAVAKNALKAKRDQVAGKINFPALRKAAIPTLAGWEANNTPKSFAIWTVWAAALSSPKDAATSAQRATATELAWQVNRTKQFLQENQSE